MNQATPQLIDTFITSRPQYSRTRLFSARRTVNDSANLTAYRVHSGVSGGALQRTGGVNQNTVPQKRSVAFQDHPIINTTKPTGVRHAQAQDKAAPKRHVLSRLRVLQLPILILLALILGPFLQTLVVGEVLILIYAVYAVVRHISSNVTFLLSLISLVGIGMLYLAGNTGTLATNFAIYCFLILIVGTVSLGLELRSSYT